nr:ribonuclease H-like domain-containing protein [Tanacetum cinerariifolium]
MSSPMAVAFTTGPSSVVGPLANLAHHSSYYYDGPTLLPAAYSHLVAQPAYSMAQPNLAAPIAHPTGTPQPEHVRPTPLSRQPTTLPRAFNRVSLLDLASGAWNMDTGASSHLNNSVTNLHDVFNTCMYPSISDFLTRRVLLRCDSTRDLYPVTVPSSIPHAFLISQHTWHQRLGHPGGEVLCHLVSSNFISCNKEKPPLFCHACQLGKHVRLPFVSSEDTFDLHPTLPNLTLTTPTIEQTDPLPHQQHPTEPAAQQSPTAASPTPAFPSSAQIHSPVQQPSPMAQHTQIQLQFSSTAVSHQTTIVSDQHAPIIIQNPPVHPNPNSVHLMVTHFRVETNRPTKRLNLHVSSVSPLPKSYRDAFNDLNWQNTMRDEYTALIRNKTWTLVPRPPDTNIVHCMWLFHHKYLADDTLSRYKARLVANGSTQMEGVDVDEAFSLVVKPGTIRTVLCLAASRHWPIHQLGVKNAFLHGDLSETVCLHMHDPREPHLSVLKRILWYIQGTLNYGLQLISSSTTDLVAYSDADWAGCPTTRRSTSGYYVFLGNNLLFMSAKRQPTLSRSSAEAEYHGVANAVAETCWLRNLLRELHTPLSFATLIYYDNVSAVYLSSNPVQHQCTKHIEIDIYFVRDLVVVGQVRVLHVPSRYQFADIFTKELPSALFEEFRSSLSV